MPHPAPAIMTATADFEGHGPRVDDDMTVEVALSVMLGAGVARLLLCDADDERTGSVSRAELVAHRDSLAYTDRVRLRDVLGAPRPVAVLPSAFSL